MSNDIEPSAEDWDLLFRNKAYANLMEHRKNYDGFLKNIYRLSFMPSKKLKRDEFRTRSEFHAMMVDHLLAVADRWNEIEKFVCLPSRDIVNAAKLSNLGSVDKRFA